MSLDSSDLVLRDSDGQGEITPSVTGTVAAAINAVTVRTDALNGFRLYVNTNNAGGNMEHQSASGVEIAGMTSTGNLQPGYWGMTLGSNPFVANNWRAVPNMNATGYLLRETNAPQMTGVTTEVSYGTKVGLTQLAGHYQVGIVYTALPKI
jgi:hypothetical protein